MQKEGIFAPLSVYWSGGIVSSIEVFDNEGELIVQFFGKRKPRIPEG
ncbi:hypothetical protein FXV77_13285 [Sphingobacterium phlebotomi]|uniref:Haemin-degrading HemS/ChuX domain-containing protein n=1 Tax=Sphingobacterium phlebotomi TaxID=2605433 RepID=A0A5D4H442_9SPHI|nr:hypothetical protein FXV77_13285 [Sphingobacterium phlebotomi]